MAIECQNGNAFSFKPPTMADVCLRQRMTKQDLKPGRTTGCDCLPYLVLM
jgi:hypothetical protein